MTRPSSWALLSGACLLFGGHAIADSNADMLKPVSLLSVNEQVHQLNYPMALGAGVATAPLGNTMSPPLGAPIPLEGPTGDPLYMAPESQSGYPITEGPYDNPGTDLALTPTIPESSDCTVRPATVIEIQRMRQTAARIAKAISVEVTLMEKRKAYVEQMTAYLNDRIRELNKVKKELQQEIKWVTVSNDRIRQLSQKEKLAKMQDILACLNEDEDDLKGETSVKAQAIKDLQLKAQALQDKIQNAQKQIVDKKNSIKKSPTGGIVKVDPQSGAEVPVVGLVAATTDSTAGAAATPAAPATR